MPTTLAIDVAYTYQYYPRSLEDDTVDTQVIAFEFSLPDILLEPTLAIEWDIQDEDGAVYANFGLSHSFELIAAENEDDDPVLAFTLGGNIGFGNTTRNDLDAGYSTAGFTDYELRASLDWACGAFTVSPFFAIADQLDGRRRDAAREADGSRSTQYYGSRSTQYYGGVSCALSF